MDAGLSNRRAGRTRCDSGVWCLIVQTLFEPNYPPVYAEEMGFALSLFVNAATCRIAPRSSSDTAFSQSGSDKREQLYLALCGEPDSFPELGPKQANGEATLQVAFCVLCEHYEDYELQASICARVLAFYFLMARSAGAVLAGWLRPCPESSNLVALHPAVILAIATVKLNGSVFLPDSHFRELVEKMASENALQ